MLQPARCARRKLLKVVLVRLAEVPFGTELQSSKLGSASNSEPHLMAKTTAATEVSGRASRCSDPSASKPCVDCADDEEKPAGTAPSRLDLLARQQLAGGTAHHAVALTDPEFKAIGSSIRNLDFAQAAFKVTPHRFFPQLPEAADRIGSPREP